MNKIKQIARAFVFLALTSSVYAQMPENVWDNSKKIEEQIKRTSFPEQTYNIKDFGAEEGDSILSHEAINQAIKTCSENGGGSVIIPKGVFLTGPIVMKSNVNLHLEEGSELKFSTDKNLYTNLVLTRWEGVDCYNLHPLIYAYDESNIAITGKGIIDGQGSNENWWYMCGNPNFGWKKGMEAATLGGRRQLLQYSELFAPLAERVTGPNSGLRPQLINLYNCHTILIQDVTLKNSPFWVIHPLLSESVIVSGVRVESHGPNSDGCDPESCKNVLIENCFFDTGDDCIAIKSGRNADGRRWNTPSENIIVRNCKMVDGHGGVVIGSEISGGFNNLFVENCEMDSPNLDRVIRIKTNNCRGGVIENVYVRNITVGECREAILKINLLYDSREVCDRSFPPTVRNIYLDKITSKKSEYGILITGFSNSFNIENIQVSNSRFDNVEKNNQITGAKDVILNNLYINNEIVK